MFSKVPLLVKMFSKVPFLVKTATYKLDSVLVPSYLVNFLKGPTHLYFVMLES